MRAVILAPVVVALLAGPALSAERLPSFPKRAPYDEARSSLITLGWRPVAHEAQRCDASGCFDRCAIGFEARCKAYPEAETCRGTGLAACDMIWTRGDRVVEVRTIGEDDPPMVDRVRCRAGC